MGASSQALSISHSRRSAARLWRDGAILVLGVIALGRVSNLAGHSPLPHCKNAMVDLEFAGAHRLATVYGSCWKGQGAALSSALRWDSFAFIPLYVGITLFLVYEAWDLAEKHRSRTIARAAAYAAVGAGVADLAENVSLFYVRWSGGRSTSSAEWALSFALVKFSLLGFALGVGVIGVFRLLRTIHRAIRRTGHVYDVRRPTGATAWERNFAIPDNAGEDTRPDGMAIALSGGGIRSATFCMGALESLQQSDRTGTVGTLDGVSYITAVSGGGYFAGSRELLTAAAPTVEPFAPGSCEIDWVRCHGRYVADSLGEWIGAIARLIAGLVLNLGAIVAMLYVCARPIGWLQSSLLFGPGTVKFHTTTGMWRAIAIAGALSGLAYVAAVISSPQSDAAGWGVGDRLYRLAAVTAATSLVIFAVVFVLPWIAFESAHLTRVLTGTTGNSDVTAASGGLLSALTSWLAARPRTKAELKRLFKRLTTSETPPAKKEDPSKLPTRVQRFALTQVLPVALLIATALYLFARFVADARTRGIAGKGSLIGLSASDEMIWLAVLGALGVLFVLADQTTWSLHPYYKRRLATAFALTRKPDGTIAPFDYALPTPWAVSGKPELVLCAAANFSGTDAPPGRRARSFTFERQWIGGPQVSYVRRGDFIDALGSNEGDGTLLAAMAISGAAFASAMGRHSRGTLNAVLATFNLRLGVWLPAPEYMRREPEQRGPKTGRRRLNYLLKEIFGIYDEDDRFLYVSDGGHWENLGLVEALRRRCKTIFCFDASGGPLTLLEAVRLANEELGVEIDFSEEQYESVREGSAETKETDPVHARMATTNVLVGKITYPYLGWAFPSGEGTLVYARAVLVPETEPTILEHASRNLRFPNDPTGDQWFDADQFESYLRLGEAAGRRALSVLP